MRSLVIGLAVILGVSVGVTRLTAEPVTEGATPSTVQSPAYPACEFDEVDGNGTECFWDARNQGNGQGTSFWVTTDTRMSYAVVMLPFWGAR